MKNNKAIGVLYFQIIKRSLADSLQQSGSIKRTLASLFRTHIMVSGNTLVTGEYGFHFIDALSNELKFKLIDASTDVVRAELRKEGIKVGAHLKKDYKIESLPAEHYSDDYTLFQVQPNMDLELRDSWNSMEDYLSDVKSKYRVKYRRAQKKCAEVIRRELSLDDLKERRDEMYAQYMETVEGAGFNLFYLNKDYNIHLKENFKEAFKVFGYFVENELIGYYTLFENGKELEAHFLGYAHKYNAKFQTYLNFLYDMIDFGITNNFHSINLSRTAMEIKSSVGAKAIPLKVFLKYNNRFINKFMPRALEYFVPEDKWLPRNPFKS